MVTVMVAFTVIVCAAITLLAQFGLLDDPQRRDELERMLGGQEFLAAVAGDAPETA